MRDCPRSRKFDRGRWRPEYWENEALALSLLAKLTSDGEICAAVDSGHGFDPITAKLAGVELNNLLWVRCGRDVEKTFMAADHIVQAKGFGCIWMDLGGLPEKKLRMVRNPIGFAIARGSRRRRH